MNQIISTHQILIFSTALILLPGIIISSLEDSSLKDSFFKNNLLDWRFTLAFQPLLRPSRASNISNVLFGHTSFRIISLVRGSAYFIAVCTLFVSPNEAKWFLGICILSYFYLFYRLPYSLDGSDQMTLFVLICLTVMTVNLSDSRYLMIGAATLAIHATVSFLTSGIAKLFGPLWRNGQGLNSILNSAEFGHSILGAFLSKNPQISKFMSWSIIMGHLTVAITFILGQEVVFVGVIISLIFHLSVAAFMRLNVFIWSFGATYPAVIFIADWQNREALWNLFVGR